MGGHRPAHTLLLAADIPVVDHLTHLDLLPATGATFTAVLVAVRGMGTFPVRAFATTEYVSAPRRTLTGSFRKTIGSRSVTRTGSHPLWVRSLPDVTSAYRPRSPLSHPYQSEPASAKALRRCVQGTGSSLLRFPQARLGLELGGETAAGRSPGEGAP